MQSLILASTSRYRADMLRRLGLPFRTVGPHVDETPLTGESPDALALRLAQAKADAVAEDHARSVVIGSDQVLSDGRRCLGKPGSVAAARAQLAGLSGHSVTFFTALCVLPQGGGAPVLHVDRTEVRFRELSAEAIRRYVDADNPIDCAGSFKVEALGISLFESVRSDDPTALVGLPLIALCTALQQCGFTLP